MTDKDLQFTLLQARNAGDPVRLEERAAFAERLGVDVSCIHPVDILTEHLHLDLLENRDALLVGGAGEHSVVEPAPGVQAMIEFLGETSEQGFPTFASCFGFQSIVLALGGDVIHDEDAAEVGSFFIDRLDAAIDDPVFGSLPERFVAQQGHKDRASRLPEAAVCLAKSELAPFQAIRIGTHPVYATQFHPELTRDSNRARFKRYLSDYQHVFGRNKAQEMLDEFMPSPHASGLLGTFADALRSGAL